MTAKDVLFRLKAAADDLSHAAYRGNDCASHTHVRSAFLLRKSESPSN